MNIGDILEIAPSIFSFEGVSDPDDGRQRRRKKLPCTVIWVHPAKRFFVVEFRSAITGETWREAVWFPLRQHSDNFNRLPIIGGRKV